MTGESKTKISALGGAAAIISTALTQPADYIKVQTQLHAQKHHGEYLRPWVFGRQVVSRQGFSQLWAGLTAATSRQVLTAAIRSSIYGPLIAAAAANDRYHSVSMDRRTVYSCFAGATAAFVTNPFEVVLVRMQTDHLLSPELRRNYSGTFDGFYKLMAESNYRGLAIGATPNMARAALLTGGMIGSYDLMKGFFAMNAGDVHGVRLIAAFIASIVGCTLSYPFDNAKTRLMHQVTVGTKPYYKNLGDCLVKMFHHEKTWGVYSGYWSYFFKVFPQVTITMFTIDYLQYLFCTDSV